jgi:basic membrane protein A and related proteins
MRRPAAILVGLLLLNGLLLVVGHALAPERPGPKPGLRGVRVGLVFDVGGLGDKSFNDAAHRGLLRAERELGADIRFIEPGDGSDRESALRQMAARKMDLVIGVGFVFSADLDRLASAFPDVRFAGIDYSPGSGGGSGVIAPNLAGLRFREEEGSFLVGAIAGLVSKRGKVGFVGGMKIPLIAKFEAGYRAGVLAVCPRCEVMAAYAGTEPKAFADPTMGRELASTQYARGADVIYHASGKTGAGVFAAARERGAWAIGVDSDQFHEAPCCVLTSMVKRVDVAVFDIIHDVAAGRFQGGLLDLGLAEEGVGFVHDDNNRDRIPAAVVDRVRALGQEIIAGRIQVPAVPPR